MESSPMGVAFESEILSPGAGVVEALDGHIPPGPETLLICGVRVRSRGGGLFSGTVTEQMMKLGRFNVLALRIVQPGLLGLPDNILLPVSGAPAGLRSAFPILGSLARLQPVTLRRILGESADVFGKGLGGNVAVGLAEF
jgi:hypothetical protein